MLSEIVVILPLIICSVVSVALVVIFRKELRGGLRDLLYSLVTFACIGREVVKDLSTRKNNRLETAPPAGNVAVVTGARGIGFEVIKKLLERNCHVIIGCREVSTGKCAVDHVRATGIMAGTASVFKLDLSSLASVRVFAEDVLQDSSELHILVNNAGVSLKKRELTEEGHERTLATNYLGHCFLTHLLLPRLTETARTRGRRSRVVNVASVAHCFPFLGALRFEDLTLGDKYQEYSAYCQSKLAQVMFTMTLDAKLRAKGVPVDVFSLHPGIVYTTIVSNSILHRLFGCVFPLALRSPEQGARTVYYACASPDLDSRGGAYIYSCEVTPPGKSARSEEDRAKLWTMMMDMLDLNIFGNIE